MNSRSKNKQFQPNNESLILKRQRSRIQRNMPTTLLSKQWASICIFSALEFFFFLKYLTSYITSNSLSNTKLQCSSYNLSSDEATLKYVLLGASGSACFMLVSRLIFALASGVVSWNIISAYAIAITIMVISFTGEVIMSLGIIKIVCVDAFGVRYPVIQMCEWQITVPLMMYLNITLDTKKNSLTLWDCSYILACFLGIIVAILPIFMDVDLTSMIFASCILFIYAGVMNYWDAWSTCLEMVPLAVPEPSDYLSYAISLRRLRSAIMLLFIFTAMTAVYFLRAFKLINHEMTFVLFSICNFLAKNIYSLYLMEGHLEVLDPAIFKFLAERHANSSRRAFIRYVFHELRSPLNSMVMGLQILFGSGGLKGEEEDEALYLMKESTQYISETLNCILGLQSVEESYMNLSFSDISISELLLKSLAPFKDVMEERGIHLRATIESNVPKTLLADSEGTLSRVLSNLLSNAIKFSLIDSRIDIKISMTIDPNGESSVHFAVTDEGVGVSEEDIKFLFRPFARLRTGEVHSQRGAGVGLAICKEIVDMHGGVIGCTSVQRSSQATHSAGPAPGSTFFFTIPTQQRRGVGVKTSFSNVTLSNLVKSFVVEWKPSPKEIAAIEVDTEASMNNKGITSSKRVEDPFKNAIADTKAEPLKAAPDISSIPATVVSPTTSPVAKTVTPIALSRPQTPPTLDILVVDDVFSNRKMLTVLLKRRQLASDNAEDGEHAVNVVAQNLGKFNIIFMDNMMPKMTGVQATRKLRTMGYQGLIIGLTGNMLPDEVLEFEESGADSVFAKPLSIKQLDALLHYAAVNGTCSTIANRTPALNDGTREKSLDVTLKQYV